MIKIVTLRNHVKYKNSSVNLTITPAQFCGSLVEVSQDEGQGVGACGLQRFPLVNLVRLLRLLRMGEDFGSRPFDPALESPHHQRPRRHRSRCYGVGAVSFRGTQRVVSPISSQYSLLKLRRRAV